MKAPEFQRSHTPIGYVPRIAISVGTLRKLYVQHLIAEERAERYPACMTYSTDHPKLTLACPRCSHVLHYVTSISCAGRSSVRIYNCEKCMRLEWITASGELKSPKHSMQSFVFRCTTTGRETLGWTEADQNSEFEPVVCTECEKVHLIKPATGESVGVGGPKPIRLI